jgi:hypothetical protein
MDNEMGHGCSGRNQTYKVAQVFIRVEVINADSTLDGDGDLDAYFDHFLDDVDDSLRRFHEHGAKGALLHPWTRASHYFRKKINKIEQFTKNETRVSHG